MEHRGVLRALLPYQGGGGRVLINPSHNPFLSSVALSPIGWQGTRANGTKITRIASTFNRLIALTDNQQHTQSHVPHVHTQQ